MDLSKNIINDYASDLRNTISEFILEILEDHEHVNINDIVEIINQAVNPILAEFK